MRTHLPPIRAPTHRYTAVAQTITKIIFLKGGNSQKGANRQNSRNEHVGYYAQSLEKSTKPLF
jgi:hypothetical protein